MKKLTDGVYLCLKGNKLIPVSEYNAETHSAAKVAVVYGSKVIVLSDKNAPEEMNWDDAMSYAIKQKMRLGKKTGWMIIDEFKPEIQKALKLLGHDPIPVDWIWTETELSSYYAWYYTGPYGFMYALIKNRALNVRPVTAFQL